MLPWSIQSGLQFLLHEVFGTGMVQWRSQSVPFYVCSQGKKNVQTVEEFSPMSFLFLSLGKQDRNGAEGKITPKLKVRHPLKAVFW